MRPSEDQPEDSDILAVQYGQTLLDEDARFDLVPGLRDVNILDELNAAEAENIAAAQTWLQRHPFESPEDLLDQVALRDLHRRMFNNVWQWAGKLRQRETNLGVAPGDIPHDWQVLLGNTIAQIEHQSYPFEEIGIRFHRSMVAIHCFANGNGRHARLAAGELARTLGLGERAYTWGARSGIDPNIIRERYLDALRLADATDDHGDLLRLARS